MEGIEEGFVVEFIYVEREMRKGGEKDMIKNCLFKQIIQENIGNHGHITLQLSYASIKIPLFKFPSFFLYVFR